MFFYVSKIVWLLISPPNLLAILLALSAFGLFTRFARAARLLIVGVVSTLLVIGGAPLGQALMRPLEDRFPQPAPTMPAPHGIIVLGGAVSPFITAARGVVELNEAGDRMTAAVMLARQYPQARVVFTGGSAAFFGAEEREADVARRLFLGLGLAPERLVFEDRSRNTAENAAFTRDLVQPADGEKWLLVTSASHMPRAIGVFRKAGFKVAPYPVDYTTSGRASDVTGFYFDVGDRLALVSRAIREYVGLTAYRLTGQTDEWFPGP